MAKKAPPKTNKPATPKPAVKTPKPATPKPVETKAVERTIMPKKEKIKVPKFEKLQHLHVWERANKGAEIDPVELEAEKERLKDKAKK